MKSIPKRSIYQQRQEKLKIFRQLYRQMMIPIIIVIIAFLILFLDKKLKENKIQINEKSNSIGINMNVQNQNINLNNDQGEMIVTGKLTVSEDGVTKLDVDLERLQAALGATLNINNIKVHAVVHPKNDKKCI